VSGVLFEQLADLRLGEGAQRRGLCRDVEGRRGPEPPHRDALLGGQGIVAHLPLADERDAPRERGVGAADVPPAELGQERHHRLAHEPIRLVDEHEERARSRGRQPLEVGAQRGVRVPEEVLDLLASGPRDVGQGESNGLVEAPEHRAKGGLRVGPLPRCLDVDPHRTKPVPRVVVVLEPPRARRLARLATRVQREVLLLLDELHDPAEAALRRQHVVLPGDTRTGDVEREGHRRRSIAQKAGAPSPFQEKGLSPYSASGQHRRGRPGEGYFLPFLSFLSLPFEAVFLASAFFLLLFTLAMAFFALPSLPSMISSLSPLARAR
jgi:hypothetical protein